MSDCELSLRDCDGVATTAVDDDGEQIPCCALCATAWNRRIDRQADAAEQRSLDEYYGSSRLITMDELYQGAAQWKRDHS